MDAYSVKVETGNKEAESSGNDATATLQQMIAGSSALMSPLFLPTTDGSTASTALPWVVPQYSMMVLPQSFLSAHGAGATVSDGHHVFLAPAASTATADTIKVDRAAVGAVGSSQSVAAILQRRDKHVVNSTVSAQPDLLRQYFVDGTAVTQSPTTYSHAEADLKPPKKPLTPYMTFSKMVWPSVKAANPHLSSVTEIGAVVGAMWRELDPSQKQRYNDQFSKEKAAYSEELHSYLKTTGLHASDLIKPKLKKKDVRPPVVNQHHVPAAVPQAAGAAVGTPALTAAGQQLIQTLLGLQTGSSQDGLASSAALQQVLSNPSSIQQVLAQMSANGQLFANSDGSISVDGSLLTIQGQSVQLAGDQLSTATSSANAGGDLSATDQSRSWAWHQPTVSTADHLSAAAGSAGGVVLYQLPSGATATGAGDAAAAAATTGVQSGSFYSIDQYGQVVRHDGPAGSGTSEDINRAESHLHLQVLQLQAALAEKSREVDDLRQKLSDAYSSLERLKNENEASVSTGANGSSGDEQFAASAVATVAATSETGSVAPAVTVVSPSTPS